MFKNLILGSGISFILSLGSMIFLARFFNADFISAVKLVTIYSGIISAVCTFHIHSSYLYYSHSESVKSSYGELFFTKIVKLIFISSALSFMFFLLLHYSFGIFKSDSLLLVLYSAFFSALNVYFIVSPALFYSQSDGKKLPIFMLTFSSATFISLVVSFLFKLDVEYFFLLCILLQLSSLLISPWGSYFSYLINNLNRVKLISVPHGFFNYSKNMTFSTFVESVAEKVDKIIASRVGSVDQFSKYSVLSFENPLINIILSSLGISLVKEFGGRLNESMDEFYDRWRNSVRYLTFITFPMASIFILEADLFVNLLFGADYLDSVLIFKIYACVAFIRFAPFQVILRVVDLTRLNVYLGLAFILSASTFSLILIVFNYSFVLLPISFFIGWLAYNLTALYFIACKTSLNIFRLLCLDILVIRFFEILIAYLVYYYTNFIFFIIFYFLMAFILEKNIRKIILLFRLRL